MKDCEYYQELISRLLDDDLKEEENAALHSHLRSCAECRLLFEAFSGISVRIGDSMEEIPDGLHENIMAELRRADVKKKNRRLRPILAAAACFALILLGTFGIRSALRPSGAAAPMAVAAAAGAVDQNAIPEKVTRAVPSADGGQNSMLFAAAPAERPCAEEAAETESFAADATGGTHVTLPDTSAMEALRRLLSDTGVTEEEPGRLLFSVLCEEDGSTAEIYERADGGLCYADSLDGKLHGSACGAEACEAFFTEIEEN